MEIYRLTPTRYANDISGMGAKLHGGRWNHKGIPCVYASQSRALCVVEFSVHVRAEEFPGSLTIVTYDVPNKGIYTINPEDLPENWREFPAPEELKNMGSALLMQAKYLMIKAPSSVIPREFNYFLNPQHKDFYKLVSISDLELYEFDHRIKE